MKYIRLFEGLVNRPKVGDYVICKENSGERDDMFTDRLNKFLLNNVGQVIKEYKGEVIHHQTYVTDTFEIKYEDRPKELESDFSRDCVRTMYLQEILYHSSDKEEVVGMLSVVSSSDKYNM